MFSLRNFVKKGLLDAVGKMADYQVILNAVGWHEKGVLNEDDLMEINTKIDAQYAKEEIENSEEIPVETTEDILVGNPEEVQVENPEV